MIPRGEVGLIFAGIGTSLTLPDAQGVSKPVVGAATFGAVVIMVIITTLVTPPLLKWSLGHAPSARSHPTVESGCWTKGIMNTAKQVNILGPEFKANPFSLLARLRAEQPVCRVTLPDKTPGLAGDAL